ncbi:radical SAM protein [Candidatus Woesearchaeota archaeon]|nr:radical SAM protein [Candidatus Woesearchaeota archaeon]
MAKIAFEDLSFEDKESMIKVNFLRIFYFHLPKNDLKKIGDFALEHKAITFRNIPQEKAERKFYLLLEKGFKSLRNSLNNKKTVYVHKNSAVPLIGNVSFGLIDRGTNVIEVKPVTGCNLRCIYCSVDEDRRDMDFVVEKDYLVDEFKKLVRFKGVDSIEAHIASQGEPLLYSPLPSLGRDLSRIREVKTISVDTNGTLLTKSRVDELVDAGLTRFNLSINALHEKLAEKISGTRYNIRRIKDICGHIIKKKAGLIITPVLLPTVNVDELPKIIGFAKEIGADIGIQNFLDYKLGRNPVKQVSFDEFYKRLKGWELKYRVKLIKSEGDFGIIKTRQLPKPFKKGDVIEAEIVCPGRLKNEKIAVAKERTISIPNCHKDKGRIRLRITRSKHNIFIGAL